MAQTSAVTPALSAPQIRTAMQSQDQLLAWLEATGRSWLVVPTADLVRGQVWPQGVETLMAVIAGYRDYRMAQPSGEFETLKNPANGKMESVARMKGERLEVDELDRAIRYLVGEMRTRRPGWSLDDPAL